MSAPDAKEGYASWVAARTALTRKSRVYDRLFMSEQPNAQDNFLADLNPASLTIRDARLEPSVAAPAPADRYQFEVSSTSA